MRAEAALALMRTLHSQGTNTTVIQAELDVETIKAVETLTDAVNLANKAAYRLTWVLIILTAIGTALSIYALVQ